jgi:hypothetical protein
MQREGGQGMDVSIWWVWIAATIGVCTGIGLFAVLTMASDRASEGFPEAQTPTQTPT